MSDHSLIAKKKQKFAHLGAAAVSVAHFCLKNSHFWNKYDNQFEQVCKSMHCTSMAVLLGCVMLKVSH